MQRLTTTLVSFNALAAALLAGPAFAATYTSAPGGWYAGLSGDATWLRHSDTGGGGNVEIGYGINNFRIEAEAGYHAAGGKSGYSSTHYFNYMGNLYYDFNNAFSTSSSGWRIAPYIGGGLGDAAVHFGGSSLVNTFHHHENDFAWEGMAGLKFTHVSASNTEWYIGYRYLGTDQDNIRSNNAELGFRIHF